MKPLPWSHTALSTFVNCPRQYQHKYILKTVKEPPSPEMLWGRQVHKAFEDRIGLRTPLPSNLSEHEPFMQKLEAKKGIPFTEQDIAFDTKVKPCGKWATDVWYRGVLDFHVIEGDIGLLVDYKTGAVKPDFKQLATFAIHMFAMYPIRMVNAQYYWTQTRDVSIKAWGRDDIPALWSMFLPDLRQYMEAFKTDTWTPRQSGLCNGWCPVTTCEFWKPKRKK